MRSSPPPNAQRRQAIVQAARWCFLNFGYSKTSLGDIAQRAQLSRPLLYLQFKNKEDIFAAVFDAIVESHIPAAEAALKSTGTARSKLQAVFQAVLLDPWAEMAGAPMAAEFYSICERLAPESEARYRKRLTKVVQQLLGDKDVTEVFLLAVDGLQGDLPDTPVLKRRLRVLIERFT